MFLYLYLRSLRVVFNLNCKLKNSVCLQFRLLTSINQMFQGYIISVLTEKIELLKYRKKYDTWWKEMKWEKGLILLYLGFFRKYIIYPWFVCLYLSSLRVEPSKGRLPLTKVYNITPSDHTSTSGPSYFLPKIKNQSKLRVFQSNSADLQGFFF